MYLERMIKNPKGEFESYVLVLGRLCKDNPREVTVLFDDDVCELSTDTKHNHFITLWIPKDQINKIKQDSID